MTIPADAARSVVLIGPRGSGKTTVGRLLAERLAGTWVDSDEEIVRHEGKTIRELFAEQGEDAFRSLEASMISKICDNPVRVIMVGGGAVLAKENVRCLRDAGTVVWLTATAEELYQRIQQDDHSATQRPQLTETGGMEEVQAILEQRNHQYQEAADMMVDTSNMSPTHVVDDILSRIADTNESA